MTHTDPRGPLGIALTLTGIWAIVESFSTAGFLRLGFGLGVLVLGTIVLYDKINVPRYSREST